VEGRVDLGTVQDAGIALQVGPFAGEERRVLRRDGPTRGANDGAGQGGLGVAGGGRDRAPGGARSLMIV
jgi:hypothetical protein